MKIISKASTDFTMFDCGANQFARHPAALKLNPTTTEINIFNLTDGKILEDESQKKAS